MPEERTNLDFPLSVPDSDVLVPEAGKHDAYDEVQAEISQLDDSLEAELEELRKRHGRV